MPRLGACLRDGRQAARTSAAAGRRGTREGMKTAPVDVVRVGAILVIARRVGECKIRPYEFNPSPPKGRLFST